MMPLNDAVHDLVRSFDDDDGLPEAAYEATKNIIHAVFGKRGAEAFAKHIDATDGRYYLKEGAGQLAVDEI